MANDPKVVATTAAWQEQTVNDKGYREGVDYSLAIKNATSDAEIKQLQDERAAKIADVYDGKDPYTTPTVNKNTGKATTPTNTASKYYDSDWTPQTATAESNMQYAAQQAVKDGTAYTDFLEKFNQTNLTARDASLAWAKAGGMVPYTSGPNAGKDAWGIAKEGYNIGADLSDAALDKYAKDGFWDAVDELLYQRGLQAKANGQVYDPVPDYYRVVQQFGGPNANLTLGEMYEGNARMNGTSKAPSTPAVKDTVSATTGGASANLGGGSFSGGSPSGGGNTGAPNLQAYLQQWLEAAQQQQTNAIDMATAQAINELLRNQAATEAQLQEQRDQIAIDEAKARDNQALYAESRGDRGGIGAAQYDAIANTAAQNRLAVNQAQTQLSSESARAISELRVQGEYQKADALLQLSQAFLSQLIGLEQWAAEYGLSVWQFQTQIQQWQKEFDLSVGQLLGSYNGRPTLAGQQFQYEQQIYEKETLAEQGRTALSLGVMPSPAQLEAMGRTAEEAQEYLAALKLQGSGGSGGGSGTQGDQLQGTSNYFVDMMNANIHTPGEARLWLATNTKLNDGMIGDLVNDYTAWLATAGIADDYEITNSQSSGVDGNGRMTLYVPGAGWLTPETIKYRMTEANPPTIRAVYDHENKKVTYEAI